MHSAIHRTLRRLSASLVLLALPALLPGRAAAQTPYAAILASADTVYWYNVTPYRVKVRLGPKGAKLSCSGGARLVPTNQARGEYMLTIDEPVFGAIRIDVHASIGGRHDSDSRVLIAEQPLLRWAMFKDGQQVRNGTGQWAGLRARVGEPYDPTSEWASTHIPADHYQTVVSIHGYEIFNRAGTNFGPPGNRYGLTRDMIITLGTTPEDIVTKVFWRPEGTWDPAQWILLLANQPELQSVIPLEGAMTVDEP